MIDHLTSIVAIDRRGAIGCQNRLPWSIKTDMAFFREKTLSHAVIMGRKTFESIGGCLKKRRNLVLSHNSVLFPSTEQCRLVLSVSEAIAVAFENSESETFVVGGGATYSEFAPYVDRYLITFVEHNAEEADAFLADHIRDEFSAWSANEIGRYPLREGHDQYAFRIMEFIAPDAAERSEHRKAIANRHMSKRLNAPRTKSRSNSTNRKATQEAFLF